MSHLKKKRGYLENRLQNWIGQLDSTLATIAADIKKGQERYAHGNELREDLTNTVAWLEANDIPVSVRRTIIRCLEWNPHTHDVEKKNQGS